MYRVAVFVDAGHLFAQGSRALANSTQPRHLVILDKDKAISCLVEHCKQYAQQCSLLRIYWYDGVGVKGPSSEHEKIAACDNVKIRLGFINSQGQQKGVDSLIVTDLIDLARNKAITDAVLLAGDEDLRIGVQIAQSYGVRVHLLGIEPARSSQSKQLRNESDTTHEWSKSVVETFLSVSAPLTTITVTKSKKVITITPTLVVVPEKAADEIAPTVEQCAQEFACALNNADTDMIRENWSNYHKIPAAVDRKLLATTRDRIGHDLPHSDRATMRSVFMQEIHRIKA